MILARNYLDVYTYEQWNGKVRSSCLTNVSVTVMHLRETILLFITFLHAIYFLYKGARKFKKRINLQFFTQNLLNNNRQ